MIDQRKRTSFVENKLLKASLLAAVAAIGMSLAPSLSVNKAYAQSSSKSTLSSVRPGLGAHKSIKLGLNKSVIVELPRDARDVIVSNPEVADAIIRTSRKIFLIGNRVGQTNIFVFGQSGDQLATLDLKIERDVGPLADLIAKYIPGAKVKVEIVNDNVVLTGTVPNAEASRRAVDLANVFLTGGEATTGNFTQVASSAGQAGGGFGDVDINNPDSERRSSSIVNLLKIEGVDQVQLHVLVAEVQRGVLKQLGIRTTAAGWQIGGLTAAASRAQDFASTQLVQSNSGIGLSRALTNGASLNAVANMLERNSLMRKLAEPKLTAISGEKASFLAGGEFPVLTDAESVQRVPFGVSLSFAPVVLSPERISIQVETEVSDIDTTRTLNGLPDLDANIRFIPSLNVRRAKSTIELPSGGSMVIAGLLQENVRTAISGLPYLSRVPILGPLFSSRDYQRNETELVISVTPYLVKPVAASKITRPDLNLEPADDARRYFLSRLNKIYGSKSSSPDGQYHGRVGFIYD